MKKIAILAAIAIAIALLVRFDALQWLTLDNLKAQQAAFEAQYAAQPLLVLGLFFALYVALTAVSFPGAAIMTLAAGAIFGLVTGTIIVSFASTIGATLAFLSSRYLFRDTVQSRFSSRLKALNAGVERDGAFYLFTLRLVPAFPFFVVNLAMGLTPIRTWTFAWVSQVGMLLGTVFYVNAGTQLSKVASVGDVLSPGLIGSFIALGLLPWLGKWIVALIRRRRVYKGYKRPRSYDRNLIVIGAGSAGLVSSLIAATVKAKVTLVEASKMGGDCLNYGCVPSKTLIKSARVARQMRNAGTYGLADTPVNFRFRDVMQRVHDAIAAIEPHDSVERYTGLGVDVVEGYAKIVDPWTVEIARNDGEMQRLTSRAIVIAAGAEPFVPDLPGLEDGGYLTSDTLWGAFAKLDEMPQRMVVIGGGPIGCELSQAFARLGANVTLVERGQRVLSREDEDVSRLVHATLEDEGVRVLTGHDAVRVEDGKRLIVSTSGTEEALEHDALIVAVGRKARLSGYGLEELGIDTERTVVTDAFLATKFPNIFAAGDVAGPYQFTHVAAHQAWFASVNALFGHLRRFRADYRVIPRTTFTDPEVAHVGINEQDAREQEIAHEVTLFQLEELDRAITESATKGFVKVLTKPGKDTILGVTIVGEHAGELLAEYVLAMKHGLGLDKIMGTIHTYPTLAEANKYAAGEWKRNHAPERLLAWVGKYHAWRRG